MFNVKRKLMLWVDIFTAPLIHYLVNQRTGLSLYFTVYIKITYQTLKRILAIKMGPSPIQSKKLFCSQL